ncbi:MAG TPA: hypothetical protein VGO63_03570 [Candidatus Paceibacterota bacterium]|jgi:hypothetical protein|nr:hypothetical protein [Candidatus Paceibacterota bacterium]
MKKFIHHLRKQPEEARRHILHLLTLIFAIILIALWVYSLGANFSNPDTEAKISEGVKPFSALKDNISSLW